MTAPTLSHLDFDPATLPWIDRNGADVDSYVAQTAAERDYDLREKLQAWKELGYAVFEQAVSHALIDAYLADIREFMDRHKEFSSLITAHAYGNVKANELSRDQLDEPLLRICD